MNGLHPGLPFSYYEELLSGFKRIKPDVHMKCFTAVEIHFAGCPACQQPLDEARSLQGLLDLQFGQPEALSRLEKRVKAEARRGHAAPPRTLPFHRFAAVAISISRAAAPTFASGSHDPMARYEDRDGVGTDRDPASIAARPSVIPAALPTSP